MIIWNLQYFVILCSVTLIALIDRLIDTPVLATKRNLMRETYLASIRYL